MNNFDNIKFIENIIKSINISSNNYKFVSACYALLNQLAMYDIILKYESNKQKYEIAEYNFKDKYIDLIYFISLLNVDEKIIEKIKNLILI